MSTDRSTSAYIGRVKAQNIIASVSGGTPGGIGYQDSLLLGKIISVPVDKNPVYDSSSNEVSDASGTLIAVFVPLLEVDTEAKVDTEATVDTEAKVEPEPEPEVTVT
jgi:hypothetical protein